MKRWVTHLEAVQRHWHKRAPFAVSAEPPGIVQSGPLKGAAYDAASATVAMMEETHLLWRQTDPANAFVTHHFAGNPISGSRAIVSLCLMFEGWFAGSPIFVNPVDHTRTILWPEALLRLFLPSGAATDRAGATDSARDGPAKKEITEG